MHNNASISTSIILPTLNEQEAIAPLINLISGVMREKNYEIIIIDDASDDRTVHEIRELHHPHLRLVRNPSRIGLAASIYKGITAAKGEHLVIMDSDGNHQPRYIPFMIQSLQCFDCISASRFLDHSHISNRARFFFTKFFNRFTRLLINGNATDYFYGFFAVKKSILAPINPQNIFYGYGDYYMRFLNELQKNDVEVLEFSSTNGTRLGGCGNRMLLPVFFKYLYAVVKTAFRNFQKDYA